MTDRSGGEPLSEELEAKIVETSDAMRHWQHYEVKRREILRAFAREILQPTTEQILAPMDDPANDGLLLSEKIDKCLEVARRPHQATEQAVTFLRKQCDLSDARALKAEATLLASQETSRQLAEALEMAKEYVRDIYWKYRSDVGGKGKAAYAILEIIGNAEAAYRSSEAGKGKP